ncbi:putative disease resistance protein RGA1 [Corylus avellana]|uniref:putative disease resistance protein RGA1 n=1 Tax=Corylus avellana TaxID=13451 RepID=UPI00286CFCB3|nr:putative disease resistance protein RGA1 [Corylus avellana]
MDTLIGKFKEQIDGKKYLLVLDDDQAKWSKLKEVLMGGAKGSRILVTTRSEKVARVTGTVESYFLWGLGEHASWSLFKQMALEKGQEPEENLRIVAIGREILEKCSGVPLAIGQLEAYYASKIQKQSDYWICRSRLIQLWIAQGFVKLSDQNQCLEDVGNEYFMDLLWRSLFHEAKMDEFGNVIGCKMHDLMHDLSISVAGSMITTLDDNKRHVDEKTRHVSIVGYDIDALSIKTSLCKASRIRTFLCRPTSNNFWGESDCDAIFSSSKLLRVLGLHERNLDFFPSSIEKLKHLRHLDLSWNHNLKKLPNSITRLQNLQTLTLSFCDELVELPRDIKRLVNLRHLEIDGCYQLTYMPCGFGKLTNLQTLTNFVVDKDLLSRHSSALTELNGLNNLRGKFDIENMRRGKDAISECKAANLKEKQHLHALDFRWSIEGGVNDTDVTIDDEVLLEVLQPHPNLKQLCLKGNCSSRFPSWLLSLTNLVTFDLWKCTKCQYLPFLSQLPSLKYLSLSHLDAMEYISVDCDSKEFSSFFPSLKYIRLNRCHNLKGWWRRGDLSMEVNSDSHNSVEIMEHPLLCSFPRLSPLKIWNCPMLTSIPIFPHLEEQLDLENVNWKPLEQTMMMNMVALQSPMSTTIPSSSSTPLKIEVYTAGFHCGSRNSARGVVEKPHLSRVFKNRELQ